MITTVVPTSRRGLSEGRPSLEEPAAASRPSTVRAPRRPDWSPPVATCVRTAIYISGVPRPRAMEPTSETARPHRIACQSRSFARGLRCRKPPCRIRRFAAEVLVRRLPDVSNKIHEILGSPGWSARVGPPRPAVPKSAKWRICIPVPGSPRPGLRSGGGSIRTRSAKSALRSRRTERPMSTREAGLIWTRVPTVLDRLANETSSGSMSGRPSWLITPRPPNLQSPCMARSIGQHGHAAPHPIVEHESARKPPVDSARSQRRDPTSMT